MTKGAHGLGGGLRPPIVTTTVQTVPRNRSFSIDRPPLRAPNVMIEVPTVLLLRWNFAMAAFHLTLAILTLALGNIDLTVQTYRTGLDFVRRENNLTSDKGWDLIPKYVPSWKLPFTITTALFFLLSFTFHFLNATLLRKFYFRHLARCRTPTRWIEYFFSAPTMIILIAFALGIRDRAMLFAIAALIASTMPFGYWVETVGRPASADTWMRPLHERLLPFFLGHIPQGAAWIIIIVQLYDGSVDPEDNVPWWVFIVLWAEFILFFSFGAASALSQLYPPRYFFRGELLFQILSLVSKGLLGIILLSNVLMLSRFEDSYE